MAPSGSVQSSPDHPRKQSFSLRDFPPKMSGAHGDILYVSTKKDKLKKIHDLISITSFERLLDSVALLAPDSSLRLDKTMILVLDLPATAKLVSVSSWLFHPR